jgi:hypothetical protein
MWVVTAPIHAATGAATTLLQAGTPQLSPPLANRGQLLALASAPHSNRHPTTQHTHAAAQPVPPPLAISDTVRLQKCTNLRKELSLSPTHSELRTLTNPLHARAPLLSATFVLKTLHGGRLHHTSTRLLALLGHLQRLKLFQLLQRSTHCQPGAQHEQGGRP